MASGQDPNEPVAGNRVAMMEPKPVGIYKPSYLTNLFPPGKYHLTVKMAANSDSTTLWTYTFTAEEINFDPEGETKMQKAIQDADQKKKSMSGRLKKVLDKIQGNEKPMLFSERIGRAPASHVTGLELRLVVVSRSKENRLGEGGYGICHKAKGFFTEMQRQPDAPAPSRDDYIEMDIVCKEIKEDRETFANESDTQVIDMAKAKDGADRRFYSGGQEMIFRYPLEFLSLAALARGHPNILLLYDYTRSDDPQIKQWFGFFEFLSGGDLHTLLKRKRSEIRESREGNEDWTRKLTETRQAAIKAGKEVMFRLIPPDVGGLLELDLRRILHEILLALEYCDRSGFAHLDIKPANILIDGLSGSCKLADFGMAQPFYGKPDASGQSQIRRLLHPSGDPQYMSPEMCKASQMLDEKCRSLVSFARQIPFDGHVSDIYSVGIIAYNCLVGVPLYSLAFDDKKRLDFDNMSLQRTNTTWRQTLELLRPLIPYSDTFMQFLTLALEADNKKRKRARDLLECRFFAPDQDYLAMLEAARGQGVNPS